MPADADLMSYIEETTGLPQTETDVDASGTGGLPPDASFPDKSAAGTDQQSVNPTQPANPSVSPTTQKGQQPQKAATAPEKGKVRPLGDGLFINEANDLVTEDGRLIAQGGFARRQVERLQRTQARLDAMENELRNTRAGYAEYGAMTRAAQSYGLSSQEIAQAVDLAGRMKRGDVLGVTKDVVALAIASGYNVTDLLGKDVGDNIDMRALRTMIDQNLAPMRQQEQARAEQAQRLQQAERAYNDFLSRYEFAGVHQDDIAKLMVSQNIPPKEVHRAYYALKEFAARHDLDFSLPLKPQLEARSGAPTQGAKPDGGRPSVPTIKPLPNGQPNGHPVLDASPMAAFDDDWGSIIRRAQAATK